jgi:hypothetical protein
MTDNSSSPTSLVNVSDRTHRATFFSLDVLTNMPAIFSVCLNIPKIAVRQKWV